MRIPFLLIVLLMAGCAQPAAIPTDADTTTAPPAPVRSTATSVTILDANYAYELNDPIVPSSFNVTAGYSTMAGTYSIRSSGACHFATGEPTPEGALSGASITFTSPSGNTTRIEGLEDLWCTRVPVSRSVQGKLMLDYESGPWTIAFEGRGLAAVLNLYIEAS